MAKVLAVWERVLGRENPMTRLFLWMCLGVYALQIMTGAELSLLGGMPYSTAFRWGALTPQLGELEPWRVLSAMFVHFGVMHLGFNMMALVDLGRWTEKTLGSARFTVILVATVISGFLVSNYWYTHINPGPTVTGGASGGLFGLAGTMIGYLYARKDPAWKQIATRLVIYTVILTFVLPLNNAAHVGGAVAGVALGYLFYKENRPWRLERWFRVLAALSVVACVTSVALSNASDVWRVRKAIELQRS